MTEEEYILLYEKYISGKCTPAERKRLEEFDDNFSLVSGAHWDEALMGSKERVKASIQAKLGQSMEVPARIGRIRPIMRWSVAAAILLIISAGAYLLNTHNRPSLLTIKNIRYKNDVPAGTEKAVLTLENGSKILLDSSRRGVILKQGNSEVKNGLEGQLVYSVTGNSASIYKTSFNSVKTPAGGRYKIVLPDGTKVWLNSASSLRFPTTFIEKERKVELSGEAYFEVAKNAMKPFRVLVNGMEVKVLGTHFNVMAYNDENKVKTTLLEGSVLISKGQEKEYLKPGQQASLAKDTRTMSIDNVNVEDAIAWKNGYFVFRNEDIRSIMRKIGRWYNVDVEFEGDLSNKDFIGSISSSENVSEVLNMLELTDAVHFRIEGRRITVMP